jgi:hypothetical protein
MFSETSVDFHQAIQHFSTEDKNLHSVYFVGFEIFTTVTVKSTVLRDVTAFNPTEFH